MSQRIYRSCLEPNRERLSFDERWRAKDNGLITCWEIGRRLRTKQPGLAERAINGELPSMDWKGGAEKEIKTRKKYGSLFYLAQWQGIRGEDLDIDLEEEKEIVCSRTGIRVIFTGDIRKLKSSKKETGAEKT